MGLLAVMVIFIPLAVCVFIDCLWAAPVAASTILYSTQGTKPLVERGPSEQLHSEELSLCPFKGTVGFVGESPLLSGKARGKRHGGGIGSNGPSNARFCAMGDPSTKIRHHSENLNFVLMNITIIYVCIYLAGFLFRYQLQAIQ